MNDALGLVEIKGLAGAIAVADAMVKTANVGLIGIEKAKGFGWITIKICGDVGAVTASVQTGRAVAEQNGQLVSYKVIPRPAKSIGEVFCKVMQEPPPENPEPTSPSHSLSEPDLQSESIAVMAETERIEEIEKHESPEKDDIYLQQEFEIQNDAAPIELEKSQTTEDNPPIEHVIGTENRHLINEVQEELQEQAVEKKKSAIEPEVTTHAKKGRSAKSPGRPSKSKKKQDDNLPHSEEGSR
ncbi:MAG: BMC domain-containing protein [Clostridium sp.]|uniref:BMC domain-containing protein n=1 Tax=Clostridium sp. TaxID=1506 RepID=UPI00290CC813|nr:BMC domain-containing protein [Clostridium sp.]MDU7337053.1 BMC domain-containing protein [Clostridium sp.]